MDELSQVAKKVLDNIIDFSVSIEQIYKTMCSLEEKEILDFEENQKNQKFLDVCLEAEKDKYQELFSLTNNTDEIMNYIYTLSINRNTSDEVVERIKYKIDKYLMYIKLNNLSKELDNSSFLIFSIGRSEQIHFLIECLCQSCDLSTQKMTIDELNYIIMQTKDITLKKGLLEKKYEMLVKNPDIQESFNTNPFEFINQINFSNLVPENVKQEFIARYIQEKSIHYLASLTTMSRKNIDEVEMNYEICILNSYLLNLPYKNLESFYQTYLNYKDTNKILPKIRKMLDYSFKMALLQGKREKSLKRK